ncbi:hypothetical protein J6590_060758 [Homalodisca vitripennis]|nr:hypothetical protein J6590_060758 [Homalodisca vitripennis]
MAGQTGRLQGQDRSAVTCPSSSHARRCLIWLSCDNRRTHYAAPLASIFDSIFDPSSSHCTKESVRLNNLQADLFDKLPGVNDDDGVCSFE